MPTAPTHDQLKKLIRQIIVPFHHVTRDMRLPTGRPELENDAEHSWSVAMLACCLAPAIDDTLDLGKISQFAIAHDLVEVFADDTSVFANVDHLATKHEREQASLSKIEHDFTAFPWIADTIKAYESRESKEAQFVYAVDKYIAVFYDLLDEGRYLREIKVTKHAYDTVLAAHRQKAYTHPIIGQYYDQILALLDDHPEYFHQLPASSPDA